MAQNGVSASLERLDGVNLHGPARGQIAGHPGSEAGIAAQHADAEAEVVQEGQHGGIPAE